MTLRVLLAESGTEETLFLRDVLTDLDGARCWGDWVHLEVSHAATWADTAAILATERIDILLLDPDLPDSQGAQTFHRVQAAAPDVPVILLVEPSMIPFAERMVRDGAQDFLLKKEVDCAPLARTIRNALARHRTLAALRTTSMTDQLTGLLTRPMFLTLADRDRQLAERLSRKMMILVVELKAELVVQLKDLNGRAHSHALQQQDLRLVEAADRLRTLSGAVALVGRLGISRFGVAILDTPAESLEEFETRLRYLSTGGKMAVGAAIFEPLHPVSLDLLIHQAALNLPTKAAYATI